MNSGQLPHLEPFPHAAELAGFTAAGLPLEREMFAAWDRRGALPIPARLFLDLPESRPS
jgi:hypothetical protein